ncbi:predicted protein [Plenodomus lingam JN3]|uniref:Predicted protein n=1 Tax=Leptosphaeria maculans (strain JN3 / isolate v23.1.3 / race Av1-4-5-6-7-8) TaxID=985895 RepID=E5A7X2_LEPMJ|nr:predicted protein [Plenodomus lingam JN3]CBX99717.1 predicted protein [Plenodomus lingam JN3]
MAAPRRPTNINHHPRPTGPHSVLDSPSKSTASNGYNGYNGYNGSFATPNRSGYFSANKQLPSTPASSLPAHIQSQTWEPRTPATNYDFSSGGETPNTPQVDSEPATPDTQLAGRMGRLGETSHKKPPRRDSWMAFKGFFGASPSPSKSERDRERERRDGERDRERDKDRDRELRRPASSRKEKEGRIPTQSRPSRPGNLHQAPRKPLPLGRSPPRPPHRPLRLRTIPRQHPPWRRLPLPHLLRLGGHHVRRGH